MKNAIVTFCLMILVTRIVVAGEIHDAVNKGDVDKVRTLLKADPKLANAKDADGDTPLGNIAFRMSLTVSVDSTARGTASQTPVADSKLEIAKLLIATGASIDPETNQTAYLLGAVRGKNWPLATLLIEKGAKTDVVMLGGGDKGMTPLHYTDNAEVAKLLIAHKAPVNARDDSGFTPLNLRAGGDDTAAALAVMKVLIDAGADVNLASNGGKTPLARATEYGTKEMVELLKAHGAK